MQENDFSKIIRAIINNQFLRNNKRYIISSSVDPDDGTTVLSIQPDLSQYLKGSSPLNSTTIQIRLGFAADHIGDECWNAFFEYCEPFTMPFNSSTFINDCLHPQQFEGARLVIIPVWHEDGTLDQYCILRLGADGTLLAPASYRERAGQLPPDQL
jgi:hypothetical protein